MAGNLGATFDPSLSELLRESDSGTANIVRIVGLAVLFSEPRPAHATQHDRDARRRSRSRSCRSRSMGHTAIHPLRWLLAPLLLVHLAVAAFWFGALWPLPRRRARGRRAGRRGDRRVHAARDPLVPLVLICGAGHELVFIRSVAELATRTARWCSARRPRSAC